ncbi:aldehyde dehydrogenase family protein [Pseudaquabacterium rugosum]|uniref:aldehyde dehydrogenase (NAD(+)) n=1 Tax=Pseudaquabacterium rugosum TaxID=2984194 RepID=A0ABU9B8C0_9BURK
MSAVPSRDVPSSAALAVDPDAPIPGVLIDGVWSLGEGARLPVHDPVSRARIAWLAEASAAQVDAAVQAAARAGAHWRATSAAERGQALARIAEAVAAAQPMLVALQQRNNGKPRHEAEADVADTIATFRYYAGLCASGQGLDEQMVALPEAGVDARLARVPLGVAALIVPWNFPLVTTAWKLAPALAAGCTVVLKPSELTPLAECALQRLIADSGLPPGVVNLVCGGAATGRALVAHRGVAKVSFTGSNAVGQQVLAACGPRMTRVSLELGGKSSLIVLDDADLDRAVELAIGGAFWNAGQMCSATARICVARPLVSRFTEAFVAAARALRRGPADDVATTLGPLISARQHATVCARIAAGRAAGARLLCGVVPAVGEGAAGVGSDTGWALPATVFTDARAVPALWDEEIFGPVACLQSFDRDDEAAALANDSDHGLVATVVGGDATRARRLADTLQVGTVWINTPQLIFPQTGWGGFKHSGLGRELGPWGLQAYQELRHVIAPG